MTTTNADPETLEGFLASRAYWLRVETVDRPGGGWDVVLRIDGTYYGEILGTKAESVEYFRDWLLPLLLGLGQHHRRHLRGERLLQRLEIDGSIAPRGNRHGLVADQSRGRGVGAVRGIGHDHLPALVALAA